jgi:D-xylose transport system permease protein
MTATAAAPTAEQPQPERRRSISSLGRGYLDRLRAGDTGALPALLGLAVLVAVFTALRPVFFTPLNFANLLIQGAGVTVIAMGLVFVLLVGEIDLSAGVTSGVAAAVMVTLLVGQGLPWYVAVLGALLVGAVIGLVLGSLVARLGIPSFVVTLAAFLGFQGIVLILVSSNVSIRDPVILAIANRNVPPLWGWVLWAVLVAGYAAAVIFGSTRRRQRGLEADPISVLLLRIGALAVLSGVAVYVLNLERSRNVVIASLRGVPVVVPLIIVLLLVLSFVLTRTAYGRHVYAVGGNAEAARRAGIPVARIRTSVFVIGSTMAAIGGIVLASRTNSVDPGAGGGNILLFAVGAAVIGGTSLFGGKGRVRDAVLGGAVIAVIENGMGLLGASAGTRFLVTGLVLLVAASVDAISRKRAAATA